MSEVLHKVPRDRRILNRVLQIIFNCVFASECHVNARVAKIKREWKKRSAVVSDDNGITEHAVSNL